MSAQVLVTKPGSVSESDRALLHDSGIIVIETYTPSDIRLLDVEAGAARVGGGDLLFAAMSALNAETGTTAVAQREQFARVVLQLLQERRQAKNDFPRDERGRFKARGEQ